MANNPNRLRVARSSLELILGDITEQSVDAIVNAANASLAGGGGVDGAIHRRGGPAIMEETRRRFPEGCPTGSSVVSGAGLLPARWVIHAVGPRWRGGDHGEEELLRRAYASALDRVKELGAQSIAFPAISAGIYGYPGPQAAAVAIGEACSCLEKSRSSLLIRFCLFTPELLRHFQEALRAHR